MPEKNFRNQKITNLKIAVGSQVLENEADLAGMSAGKAIPDYHDLDFIKRELALQKRDQQRRMIAIAAGIILMVGLLGGLGYLFHNGVSSNPRTMAADRAASVYKDGLLQLPAARKIIDMVDPARRSPVSGELSGGEQVAEENESSANLEAPSAPQEALPLEDMKFIVFFKHNSNRLPRETLDTLDRVIDRVADHQITSIRVTGYTDSHGDRLYNVMLSAERANRVKAYLVQAGVPASKIEVRGLGP